MLEYPLPFLTYKINTEKAQIELPAAMFHCTPKNLLTDYNTFQKGTPATEECY